VATEQVLVEDWCEQFPSHSMSDIAFGTDGALYVGGGDGANFNFPDYGQFGDPPNPCGDPPTGFGGEQTFPTGEGGALRAQDPRTTSDPLGLSGTIIRINRQTGLGLPDNPGAGSGEANVARVIAHGVRNPFRMTVHPTTGELWAGDVGWADFDEINRIADPTDALVNLGWPCREGVSHEPWLLSETDLCTSMATSTAPYFAYGLQSPITDDPCRDSGAAFSGLAFYQGGGYPAAYTDALFFSDYVRDCIWVMFPSDGLPDPASVEHFAVAADPVHLTTGPGGDLYYVDFGGGTVRRISFPGSSGAPTASFTADVTSGEAPLTVTFDGSASTDPDGGQLDFAWDLDGDGEFDDSSDVAPKYDYGPGVYTVRLLVTDDELQTDTADPVDISVSNDAPAPIIDSPSATAAWAVGQTITFGGSATDPQEGTLGADRLDWELHLHHCSDGTGGCHIHEVQEWNGIAAGSFVAPEHEYPSYLELLLTATDQYGVSTTTSRVLQPQTVILQFETQPSGLTLNVGSHSATTPFTRTVIVGSGVAVHAPSPQVAAVGTVAWTSWSDGGEQSHIIVAGSTAATYRATFTLTGSTGTPRFSDVAGSQFADDIAWVATRGITTGCGGGRYCPDDPVTREQMASFLVRALGLSAGGEPDRFIDIAATIHRVDINRAATAGVTTGCGGGRYCPTDVVTREQMASFLIRALGLAAGGEPDRFIDIAGSIHRVDINRAAVAAITTGCGGGRYCPADPVTRGQMAAFLRRALGD
jgi:glucose/arabinose dehydrogenase